MTDQGPTTPRDNRELCSSCLFRVHDWTRYAAAEGELTLCNTCASRVLEQLLRPLREEGWAPLLAAARADLRPNERGERD